MKVPAWLRAWKRRALLTSRSRPAARLQLHVESLEDRTVPAVHTWTDGSPTTNNWSDAGNWDANGVPTSNEAGGTIIIIPINDTSCIQDIAGLVIAQIQFTNSGTAAIQLAQPLTLDCNVTFDNIINSSGTNSIDGGTLTLTNAECFIPVTGGTLTITSAIAGTQGLQLRPESTGTLTLGGGAGDTAANTYTGTTTVAGGTLLLNKASGTNAIAGNITLGDATNTDTLRLLNNNQIADASVISFTSGGFGNSAKFELNGFNETVGGILTTNAGQAAVIQNTDTGAPAGGNNPASLTVNSSNSATYDGIIRNGGGGSLRLVKAGTGTLTISNTGGLEQNSYSGGTLVRDGTLIYTNANALGTGTVTLSDGTANTLPNLFDGTGVTLANNVVVNGQFAAIGSTGAIGAASVFSGTITINGGNALNLIGGSTVGTTYTGQITGTGGLVIANTVQNGVVILDNPAATNNFAGNVVILPDAILQVTQASNAEQIPDTATISFGNAASRLRLFIINDTVGALVSEDPGDGRVDAQGGTSTLTIGGGNAGGTFSGVLADGAGGVLNLIKTGTGTQTLSGANTYTGTTTVNGGGRLLVNGSLANGTAATDVTITGNGSAVGGSGTIQGTVQAQSGAAILPGSTTATATLTTGSVTFQGGSVFGVKVNGGNAGQFDVLTVTGTVTLTGGPGLFVAGNGTQIPANTPITILANDGNDAVVGTFISQIGGNPIPQGGTVTATDGQQYIVSYTGGDGNDVTLTRSTSPPPPATASLVAVGNSQGQVVISNANTNTQLLSFRPFDTSTSQYIGLISLTWGDVNNDNVADLIIATRGKRAGKIKVFDGARILAGTITSPQDVAFVGFPLSPNNTPQSNPYTQGLTVGTGDVNNDGITDIVVASRTAANTRTGGIIPATITVYSGKNGNFNLTVLGAFQPIGTANDGLYVTAGDTNGGGAEIAVSSANRSLVKIFQFNGGSFSQISSDASPFGTAIFSSGNGDGQIRSVFVNGSTTASFVTGRLNNGVVDMRLLNGTGGTVANYSNGTGATFFALDSIDRQQNNTGNVMLTRTIAGGTSTINLLNPQNGADAGTLNTFLFLTGRMSLAGF